jgi:hypothetical protein
MLHTIVLVLFYDRLDSVELGLEFLEFLSIRRHPLRPEENIINRYHSSLCSYAHRQARQSSKIF